MAQRQPGVESQLPVKKFFIVFFILLVMVAFMAAVFGENQKISITSQRFMDFVASRDYEDAYELLTKSAKSRIDDRQFKAQVAQLRMYMRAVYGTNFSKEYKFASQKKFWFPWIDEARRTVTVGVYRKESGISNEFKEMIFQPTTTGPVLPGILTIVRERNRWLVDDINFDPADYADVLKKYSAEQKDLYIPNDFGFTFEGFIYDRRTATQDERSVMIDALSQAIQELQTDSGVKKDDSDSFLKMIP